MTPKITVEVSQKTIIFVVLFLLGLYAAYRLADVLLLLFIATLFTTAVNPVVTKLQSYKMPRSLSIGIVYVLILGILVSVLASLLPELFIQGVNLINQINLPPWLTRDLFSKINLQDLQVIANQLNSVPRLLNLVFSALSSVIVFFSLLVISFYLLIERPHLPKIAARIFSKDRDAARKTEQFLSKLDEQIGGWVRGEFFLMCIVGLLTYIGLLILGVNYALPLALIAGILELLPNIGPTVAAIPAIIVAYLSISPTMAIAVTALYVLIQQIENNFIVPFIMRKAVGLSPIITIFLLLAGFRLGGIAGSVLAIPIFLTTKVIASEFYKLKEPNWEKDAKD